MPRGDRTGPDGMGPMTGRAAGYCAGYPVPGFQNAPWGRAFRGGRGGGRGGRGGGPGRGMGWGHRHWYHGTGQAAWQQAEMGWPNPYFNYDQPPSPGPFGPLMTKEQELDALRKQAEYFEHEMEGLRNRIQEIESSNEGSE